MLEIMNLGQSNVLGFRAGSDVDGAELERAIGAVDERLKDEKQVRLYIEIPELDSVSAKALQKEITYGLKNVDKFEKVAVVTDKAWIRALAELEDKLFPAMEEKSFKLSDRKAAEEWVKA